MFANAVFAFPLEGQIGSYQSDIFFPWIVKALSHDISMEEKTDCRQLNSEIPHFIMLILPTCAGLWSFSCPLSTHLKAQYAEGFSCSYLCLFCFAQQLLGIQKNWLKTKAYPLQYNRDFLRVWEQTTNKGREISEMCWLSLLTNNVVTLWF